MAVTVEQRGVADQGSELDPGGVLAAVALAEREEQLADACQGHVPASTIALLRAERDALRLRIAAAPRARIATTIKLLHLLADVEETRQRIEAREGYARLDTYVRVQEGLARLRGLKTPQELIDAAPRQLLRTLGVSRAMVSRVRGSLWTPEVLEIADGADQQADEFQRFVAETEIPLAHLLMETELVRRRIPMLVSDPAGHPRTYKPIVEASRSTSYAAAPIMPATRVIGFFHVDRFGQELPVSAEDRDNLWVFAQHFGLLYERSVLVERLELQRTWLHELLSATSNSIDEISDAALILERNELAPTTPGRSVSAGRSPLGSLLTAREQEVLELMTSGATNNQIARELVVSEGTVKSHVKRILRKLRVDNRAGAVARYLHLMRLGAR
jgi:LuxR family transcriptional regulator, regulator of acetate metabolism